MTFLADTNIFLEILLNQPASSRCEQFLQAHAGDLALSDSSLHSIGVIALRRQQAALFKDFLNDSLPNLALLHLDRAGYPAIARANADFGLDFDDAYQFTLAKAHGLTLVTQDRHFERVRSELTVQFV